MTGDGEILAGGQGGTAPGDGRPAIGEFPDNGNNGGKGDLNNGSQQKPIISAGEGRETEESPFQFRPLAEEPDGRWACNELPTFILQDIQDLELGFVIVAHRSLTDVSATTPRGVLRATRWIARGLAATAHWSQVAGPNTSAAWDLPLRRAIELVIEEGGDGPRVFAVAVDARSVDDVKIFGTEHRAALLELERWLRSNNANLIVFINLPGRHTRRRMTNVCPEFRWWSWLGWMDDFAEKTELSVEELAELLRSVLGDLLDVRDTRADRREQVLHGILRDWYSSASDGASDEQEVRRIVEHAAAEARAGIDRGALARDRVRRLFCLPSSSPGTAKEGPGYEDIEPLGAIERIVLTVWALLERVHFVDLMTISRALLPMDEVPLCHLTPELREGWERSVGDDRRLRRETRPRVDWQTVFDARRATLLWAAGLKCVDDLKVVERGTFEKSDVLAVIDEWPESLETLLARLRGRDLLHRLPRSASSTLLQWLAAVRRQVPSLLTAPDFVRLTTGLTIAEGRMAVPTWVLEERRDLGVKILADLIGPDLIRHLGDARAAVLAHRATETGFEDFGDGVEDFEDELLLGTVDAFRDYLGIFVGQAAVADGFVDDCLDEIVARVDTPLPALMVISHLLILGPPPSDPRLGEATLRIVRSAVPNVECPGDRAEGQAFFDLFDRHLFRTLNSVGPTSARSIDRWADAVASIAAEGEAPPWQKALSSYMDDAIARHDIPWGNANRRPLTAPLAKPLFAPQFLGPHEEDTGRIGPDLIERLFARSAEDHLSRLVDFSRQGDATFIAALERRIVDLLSETYWVLSDEIDRDEIDARADVNLRLSSEIWGGITESYGLDPVRNAREAAALLLSRIEAPSASQDRLPVHLLDLFAPTILVHWRLRMFSPRRLSPEENRHYVACLERLKVAADARWEALQRAFRALVTAEDRLVDLFEANDCPRTAHRHRDRRDRIRSLADFFSIVGPLAAIDPSE